MRTTEFRFTAGQAAARQTAEIARVNTQPEIEPITPDRPSARCSIEKVVLVERPFCPLAYEVRGYASGGFAACISIPERPARRVKKAPVSPPDDAKGKERRTPTAKEISQRKRTRYLPKPQAGANQRQQAFNR
jgi:hypothetical protein